MADTRQITVTVTTEHLALLDARVAQIRAAVPWHATSRAEALRTILHDFAQRPRAATDAASPAGATNANAAGGASGAHERPETMYANHNSKRANHNPQLDIEPAPVTKTARRNALTSADPTTEWVDVTPALAAKWLERNVNNRKLDKRLVARLAADFTAGVYTQTHQGVAFDTDDNLVDGQHRLHAIVASGITVRLLVTRGLKPEARSKIDTGNVRTLPQVLAMSYGMRDAERLVPVINSLFYLKHDARRRLSPDEVMAEVEHYRAALDWVLAAFTTKRVAANFLPSPVVAALVHAHAADPARVEQFGGQLIEPVGVSEGSPVIALLNIMRKGQSSSDKQRLELSKATLNAVRAYLAEDRRSFVRRQAAGEALAYFNRFHAAE